MSSIEVVKVRDAQSWDVVEGRGVQIIWIALLKRIWMCIGKICWINEVWVKWLRERRA